MAATYDFGLDATKRQLAVGEVLCQEGGTDTEVFQVVTGSLDVERSTASGQIVVATLTDGALVGEVATAMGGNRTATLRAAEETLVSVFTQAEFAAWLNANPDSADAIAAEARMRFNRSRASAVLANLFGLENQAIVDAIVGQLQWTTLAPGDLLFAQGDHADAAYLLLAGRLHIYATDEIGETTLDIEVGRGEIVGELGILEDAPRMAHARAIRDTTLAMIPRDSFEAITAAYPSLIVRVFMTVIDRLTHRHVPDDRARVVALASTIPNSDPLLFVPLVAAVEPFGSTLHLTSANLEQYVRDPNGHGGDARASQFLHESDVAHDYVVLEADTDPTRWSTKAICQSDRFVLACSANPDDAEVDQIRQRLELLTDVQRGSAWLVRVHHSGTSRPRSTAEFVSRFSVGEVHNVRAGDDRHFARVGRLATGNGVGVVLGGGGAKGIAHIGALEALAEAGLRYDRIGGASMGAVIAGFAAQDRTIEEVLQASIDELRKDILDYTVPMVSLFKAAKMAASIKNKFGGWDILDLWIPFYCVSTNITKSELAVHRSGDMARAVRASVAIPVALPPVPIDGDLHVDGGVLDNVPVGPMHKDRSIGTVIAIDVSPPGGPGADHDFGLSVSGFDVLRNRFGKRTGVFPDIGQTLMSSMLIGSTAARKQSDDNEMVDLYLDLDLDGVGLLKFENHRAIARRGYEGAKPIIEVWLTTRERASMP